jgi:WD40 repeat protein
MIDRPAKAPRRQQRPQAKTAEGSPPGQASPSGEASPQAGERTAETVREAAFEPVAEAVAASPQAQSASATSRRDALPEATVRPRPPTSQAGTAPWLPPSLRTLLPRLVLPAALLAIPIVAAFALQLWLARTHMVYDANLLLADGGADEVTALQWSPADGALFIGTRSGSAKKMSANGAIDEILSPRDIDVADGEATSPVQSFHSLQAQWPIVVYQDRVNTAAAGPADAFAATQITPGLFSFEGGLFASVEANNGSAVIGRAVVADSGQRFNNLVNAVNQLAPPRPTARQPLQKQQLARQQQQQQQIQPTNEQVKGEAFQEPIPIDPTETASGPSRFGIALRSDLQGSTATVVGEISGIEDVRAVAALPGTNTVIAGDGEGNVFAIDAAEQISGVSPETYIRGIGQHEAAIVEIAVAAQPADGGVLFATRAEDRTIKVWRGSVSRASQLIPLGDYPSTDVTTPGSTWVREPIRVATPRSRTTDQSLTALLSMSDDGRRILARRANRELIVIDLPAPGEDAAATESDDTNYATQDTPAMLSGDGSRLIIAEATNATVELYELPRVGSDQASRLLVESFRGLAENQFRRLEFDRTGQKFVAIATSGSVHIQNVATPDRTITLNQYQDTGVDAAISPDGSLVAVAETSGQIMVHSAEDGSELTILDGPQNLGRLAFDASGKRLRASTTDTLSIYTYSLRNPRSTTYDSGLPAEAGREGFLPNGDRYFMPNGNAGYRLVDIDSGAEVGTLQAATGATAWVSNLDGSRIATLGGRGNISLFREEKSPTASGPMPVMTDNALRLSADGRTLAVGGRGGELHVARLDGDAGEAGYRLRRLRLPAPALQYEISPDGASIVTARADGTVSISNLSAAASAPTAPAGGAPLDQAEPAPDGEDATIQDTIEISGHGAPLTAMALSPDGERLATASLDGRLRITSIAWARLVHRLPFAALPSGPERAKLEPQPLDESPYVLMGQTVTSGRFDDNQPFDQPFIIVYNARKSLGQALGARERATEAGFPGALILRRQGFFRGVFAFATAEERAAALPGIQEVFSGAYSRDLRSWCPDAVPTGDFIDCTAVLAGTEPPPAMAN